VEIFLWGLKYNVSAIVCSNLVYNKKNTGRLQIAVLVLATKCTILRYLCTIPALFSQYCVTGYTRWHNIQRYRFSVITTGAKFDSTMVTVIQLECWVRHYDCDNSMANYISTILEVHCNAVLSHSYCRTVTIVLWQCTTVLSRFTIIQSYSHHCTVGTLLYYRTVTFPSNMRK
jgi:hypothetical protein